MEQNSQNELDESKGIFSSFLSKLNLFGGGSKKVHSDSNPHQNLENKNNTENTESTDISFYDKEKGLYLSKDKMDNLLNIKNNFKNVNNAKILKSSSKGKCPFDHQSQLNKNSSSLEKEDHKIKIEEVKKEVTEKETSSDSKKVTRGCPFSS